MPEDLPLIDKDMPWDKVNNDVVRVLTHTTWRYWAGVAFFASIAAMSAGSFYYMSTIGLGILGENNANFWGLDIPAFIFWIGLSHAGTFLSAVLFFTRSHWRRSIYRYAELMTLFSLLNVLMILTIHLGRPWRFFFGMPYPNFRFLWPSFRSPLAWDFLAISTYTTGSALFLYLGMVPDFGALRDHVGGWRKKVFKALSLGWQGTDREWKYLLQAYALIGAMIVPLMASVHSLVAWDFVNSLVPGFHNTMFAPFFVAGALYSGIAGVIMLAIPVRRFFHLEDYIRQSHFDKLGKLMLLLCFVWIYFQSVEAWGAWYKMDPFESNAFNAKAFGPWAFWYWLMWALDGALPMLLFSRRVRLNIPVMFVIGVLVNIGMFVERFLIIIPGQGITHLPSAWKNFSPTFFDFAVYIFLPFSLFGLLFMLSLKITPHLSMYEIKEVLTVPLRNAAALGGHGHGHTDVIAEDTHHDAPEEPGSSANIADAHDNGSGTIVNDDRDLEEDIDNV